MIQIKWDENNVYLQLDGWDFPRKYNVSDGYNLLSELPEEGLFKLLFMASLLCFFVIYHQKQVDF